MKNKRLQWELHKKRKKNPVARNLNTFNKPATHKDKKKESKKTGDYLDDSR
jgi:hypothetical protein